MLSIYSVFKAISNVCCSGQVGQPVFARCLISVDMDSDLLSQLVIALSKQAQEWLGTDYLEFVVVTGPDSRSLSLSALHKNGATSQIIASATRDSLPMVDLMIVGCRGTLYFDTFRELNLQELKDLAKQEHDPSFAKSLWMASETGNPTRWQR